MAKSWRPSYSDNVFINVPFDGRYEPIFHALVFAVHDCGFVSRCALESDDSGEVRVEKLYKIIQVCRFGIHDISRTTLDSKNKLPRFNMPLELGMFLACKRFGSGAQHQKSCLILDRDRYRYQKFCSDLAGQDIRAHENKVDLAISAVRNWLSGYRTGVMIPGGRRIAERYSEFRSYLPEACDLEGIDHDDLTYLDYRTILQGWLLSNEW